MKSKQLSKFGKTLLSVILSVALVLGLMPSLQNACKFAYADESNDNESGQLVADSNNGGGESTEQADQQAGEQSGEPSEEQATEGGETTDPAVDPAEEEPSTDPTVDADKKATTDSDAAKTQTNAVDTQAAPLGSAATTAVKIILKGVKSIVDAAIEYLDQSQATTLSGDVYINQNTTSAPIIVGSGGLNLIIKDGVTLTIDCRNMDNYAGISCIDGNPLTITGGTDDENAEPQGTGKIVIYAADHCAAIGGTDCRIGRDITIETCTVEAHGGEGAAGIGGGYKGVAENITINGGTVYAYGGNHAAGIGSGPDNYEEQTKNITINGGTVYAYGGSDSSGGAGIGTGRAGETAGITINENISGVTTYVEAHGGSRAAGIGNGDNYSGYKPAHDINITGGTVKAYGGDDGGGQNGGAGIGGGNQLKAYNISISGGDVTARSGGQAAAIGGGSNNEGYDIKISGDCHVTADARGGKDNQSGAGIGGGRSSHGHHISISGGIVWAYASYGAAIGGGFGGNLKNDGYGVDISGGHVEATADYDGAGIGSGRDGHCEGSITISGSTTCVSGLSKGRGAGIGGGANGESHNITINEGTVHGTSYTDGAGIGSGECAKARGEIRVNGGNVIARGGGGQNSCEKNNGSGCGFGCGATGEEVSDRSNEMIYAVYVSDTLSSKFSYNDGGTYTQGISPWNGNWNTSGSHNENYSKWRDVKVSNNVTRGVTVGAQTGAPEYGTTATSTYDLTANYVSGVDWAIAWYKDGVSCDAPASFSVSDDMKKLYIDYNGTADAGEYKFTFYGDGVATTSQATYTVNKCAASITSGSATKVYDGTPLTCSDYDTTGFIDGQGVYVTCTGSCTGTEEQMVPVTAPNTFTYVAQDGTNLANYQITETEGKLTVVPELFVVTAGNYKGMYDGQEHKFNDPENGTKVKVIGKNGIDYTSNATFKYKTSDTGEEGQWSAEWSETVPSIKDVKDTAAGKLFVKVQATATINGVEKSIPSLDTYTMEVTKRSLILTANSNSREYNGEELTDATVIISGDNFVTGEGFATDKGPKAKSEEELITVGKVNNIVQEGYEFAEGTKGVNYAVEKINGTLEVTPKSTPITISTNSDEWKYDGNVHYNNNWKYTDGVLVSGDVLSVDFSHTADKNQLVNAGTYSNSLTYETDPETKEVTNKGYKVVNDDQVDVTNCYTFATPVYGTLTITKRQVTLTSGSDLKVKTQTGDYAYNGTVTPSGDTLLDTEKLDYSGFPKVTEISYTPTDNTFTYTAASGSKFDANNYEITQVYGKLMLVEELAIIAGDQTFTYDGTVHQAGVTTVPSEGAEVSVKYATSSSGEEGTWSDWSTDVPTVKDVGTLYIWARATKGVQTKDAKYTATVNKRHVIITSGSATTSYTGIALTESGSEISGEKFAEGEGVDVTTNGSQIDVGSSSNTFTYDPKEGTDLNNYVITEEYGTLTVTPCASTIAITTGSSTAAYNGTALTCSDWSGKYGDTSIAPSSGSSQYVLETGDTLIVTCTGSITDVGSTQNTCTYRVERKTKSDDVTANYSFAETTCGTLTVTQRSVVINTASANKVYDGEALTANRGSGEKLDYTVTGDGFIAGQGFENVKIVGTITNVGNVPNLLDSANPYTLKEGTNPANYKITTQPGTLTVDKRKVAVTSGSAVKTVSAVQSTGPATNAEIKISQDGFVNGELAVGYPKATGSQSALGESKNSIEYTWAGAGNPANYQITENLGRLVVVEDTAVAAIATNYEGVYDGQEHSGSVETTVTPDKTEYSIDGGSYSELEEPPSFKDACNHTVAVKVYKSDKTAECTYTVKISQRPVTLTAGSASKVYDGTDLTCANYTVGGDGIVSGENPTIVMTDASKVKDVTDNPVNNVIDENELMKDVGSYKYSNYDFNCLDGTLQVTKRPLVLCSKPIGVTEKKTNQLTTFAMPDVELLSSDADKDALLQTQDAYKQIASLSNAAEVYNELQAIGTDPVKYDGNNHKDDTVVVSGMGFAEGETVSYSNFKDFKDAATYMNTFTVAWDSANEDNYDTKIIYAPVTIDKRGVTLTSATDSKIYDGTALTNDTITESGEGFVKDKGEGATFDVTGTQTKLGESANTFEYKMNDKTKDSNYDVTCTEGTLTVTISDKLNIVAPTKTTFDYTGEPQGDPATATIDGEEYTGTIWYSTDGGKTYKSSYPMLVGAGSLNVKAHVTEYGYVTSECDYTLTINAKPASEDDFISDVNQEDLNNAAEDFLNNLIKYEKEQGRTDIVKKLVGSGASAWIEGEFKATEDPDDMAKLQAAAPGKSFKYADVRLYVSLWDENGKAIEIEDESGEPITFDKFDIGDYNKIPIRITYKSDMTNTQDVECLRVHNGEVASLPQGVEAAVEGEYWQMGEGQQSVMIAASKYSTYAAAFNVPGGDNPGDNPGDDANATGTGSTGDNTNLAICVLGLLMSCCAAYALFYMRRRKDK